MTLPSLTIGDLTVATPIIQGGMGIGVSLSGLASAVAEAGGVGVISAAGIGWTEPNFKEHGSQANIHGLRYHIRRAKSRTKGVLGVNIMVAMTDFPELVKVAAEEKIDIIFSGAGLPLTLPALVENAHSPKLAPIVSSARAARILCKKWKAKYNRLPDAVVVEGPKAGGHLGFKAEEIDDDRFALHRLVPEVVAAVRPFAQEAGVTIPVIAAGGVYSGADIDEFLSLGASGVQMGTRFVATHECDASPEFKQAYLDARQEDLGIVKSPVGLPGRAIIGRFVEAMRRGDKKPFSCPFHCLHSCDHTKSPYCISMALLNARKGLLKNGLTFAGANAYRINAILSVKELFASLVEEYGQWIKNKIDKIGLNAAASDTGAAPA